MPTVRHDGSALSCPDEDTIAAFAEGRLGPEALAELDAHVVTCAHCQDLLAAAVATGAMNKSAVINDSATFPSPAFGRFRIAPQTSLERGSQVGRYTVLAPAGRGGTGEVYAAYDPELDRKVALKLLHERTGDDSERAQARLLREAKAIAKLSHPNVVTIHDAGTVGARIFIAMEFVDGETLGEWLGRTKRSRAEIVEVFKSAGRGLAAAHEAGLIHRDFKPHNVMVGKDGSVRVLDFGLVRDLGAAGANDSAPATGDGAGPADLAEIDLTRTGELLGTPKYMAPEQFKAERTDARTDQFSFCVALYEALYGAPPFAGKVMSELMPNVLAGRIAAAPSKAAPPIWLRRILLRGLEVAPERRFESMKELLAALDKDPSVSRRRVAVALIVLVAMGLVALGARRSGEARLALCRGGPDRWTGVWDAGTSTQGRKEAIHRAFVSTGVTYAEQAFASVSAALDAFQKRWLGVYEEACEATHTRGEQSAAVLDLRMACLNDRLLNARSLSDVFAQADGKVVENAVSAAAALPSIERCSDVPLLQAIIKPPDDPKTRARVDDLRRALATLIAQRDSGQCTRAIQSADALLTSARALGYQPLLADALLAAAGIGNDCGDPAVMVERYKEAHIAASASRDDEAAATASTQLAANAANRLEDYVQARIWLAVAQGDVARLTREGLPAAFLAEAEGEIALEACDFDLAITKIDQALEGLRRLLGPDHPWTIVAEVNKGDWLERAGRLQDALAMDRRAVAHFERVLGPSHPQTAFALNNLGEVLNMLRAFDEAEATYERALTIFRKSGSDKYLLAWVLTGIGRARVGLERPESAVGPLEEALAIREQTNAPAQLAETRFNLARALWFDPAQHDRARALALAARTDARRHPDAIQEIDRWLATTARNGATSGP